MTSLYRVAYDISNDKRRCLIAHWLEDRGQRVQYSVFDCELGSHQLGAFVSSLQAMIDDAEDRIVIYPLCLKCLKSAEQPSAYSDCGEPQVLNRKGFHIL